MMPRSCSVPACRILPSDGFLFRFPAVPESVDGLDQRFILGDSSECKERKDACHYREYCRHRERDIFAACEEIVCDPALEREKNYHVEYSHPHLHYPFAVKENRNQRCR